MGFALVWWLSTYNSTKFPFIPHESCKIYEFQGIGIVMRSPCGKPSLIDLQSTVHNSAAD